MVSGSIKQISGHALVVIIRALLYCVLLEKVSGGLLPMDHFVPIVHHVPLVPTAHFHQPYYLTSGAAPILQPVIQNVFGALGLRSRPYQQARPSLPQRPYSVRQPDIRPGAPNNASQGKSDEDHDWSYDNSVDNPVGPGRWNTKFPKCSRTLQSPIDLAGPTVRYQQIQSLVLRTADGSKTTPVRIKNDGASVSMKPITPNVIIEGGSLPGQFVVTNLHFHWSHSDLDGSEHRIDGKAYPLEIHIVTFNRKYRNLQEATGASDGIHAIAVMYEISKQSNVGLNICTSKLDAVMDIGAEVDGGNVDISSVLPGPGVPIFRYRGSLTTPPCTENIIWSVYARPQVISIEQLHKFRKLKQGTKSHSFVGANIRPLQPVDNRIIFTNSPTFSGK